MLFYPYISWASVTERYEGEREETGRERKRGSCDPRQNSSCGYISADPFRRLGCPGGPLGVDWGALGSLWG